MSKAETDAFIAEFKKLSPQSNWFPGIVDEHARLSREQKREHFQREYLSDLKRSVEESSLIAVDGGHMRCKVLSLGAYIPYKEAARYLESRGHVVEGSDSKLAISAETKNTSTGSSSSVATESHRRPKVVLAHRSVNSSSSAEAITSNEADSQVLSVGHKDIKTNSPTLPSITTATVNSDIEDLDSEHAAAEDSNLAKGDKHINLLKVIDLIGFGKTTIYAMMKEGDHRYDPSFPKFIPKSEDSSATRWSRNAIQAWMSKRVKSGETKEEKKAPQKRGRLKEGASQEPRQ